MFCGRKNKIFHFFFFFRRIRRRSVVQFSHFPSSHFLNIKTKFPKKIKSKNKNPVRKQQFVFVIHRDNRPAHLDFYPPLLISSHFSQHTALLKIRPPEQVFFRTVARTVRSSYSILCDTQRWFIYYSPGKPAIITQLIRPNYVNAFLQNILFCGSGQ